jgi:opacity protein-like surface antigen
MRFTLFSAALLATGLSTAAVPMDGWYLSAFGGYSYIPDHVNNTLFGYFIHHAAFKNGYNAGARVGYQNCSLRYEAEYTYLHGGVKGFQVYDISQLDVSGHTAANAIMANVYYDTPEILSNIAPYLGLGIGYAYIKDHLNSVVTPLDSVSFHAKEGAFAYQGTAGFSYNFCKNYALTLAYRYLATASSNKLGSRFQAHMASVGVVYHFDDFDDWEYK